MNDLDLAAYIINFDSDDFSTHAFFTIRSAPKVLTPVPWPAGESPVPQKINGLSPDNPLPECDIVIVTWTMEEGKALSDVLTPAFNSKTGWYSYTKDFASYKNDLTSRSPARESKRLGSYFLTKIKSKKVLCFKSELHMSTDGIKLPVKRLWQQIIDDTKAGLIITTGTAGGIGAKAYLGDVVISKKVRFDCTKTFKNQPFAKQVFITNNKLKIPKNTLVTKRLLAANNKQLPVNSPMPAFFSDDQSFNKVPGVVTTDFFAFDNLENTYKLKALGSAVEMGDAVLALLCNEIGKDAPSWISIRNVSDPEIKDDVSLEDQKQKAAQIYEQYGYWTTVCSAIACWALIVEN